LRSPGKRAPEPPPDPLVVNSKARRDNSQGADELDKGTRQHIQQALQVNITMHGSHTTLALYFAVGALHVAAGLQPDGTETSGGVA
jgi:hypothetical protein